VSLQLENIPMLAVELLLSPFGRMKRLTYILLSSLFSAMNFCLLILLGLRSGSGVLDVLANGPLSVFHASPILSLAVLAGMWMQLCFVFKRSRDCSGTANWGWAFLIFWVAPFVGPDLMNTAQETGGRLMWQVICAVPAALVGFMLLLRNSQPQTDLSGHDGDRRRHEDDGSDIGNLDESTDLIARARALPNLDAPSIETPVAIEVPPAIKPVQSGFGRRRVSPLNARP